MTEKKKKSPKRMNRWRFLALWIIAHLVAWTGTFTVIENLNVPTEPWWIAVAAIIVFLGLLPGTLIALPQKWLLKRGFGLDINWWRRASIAAWASGGLLLWIVIMLLYSGFENPSEAVFALSWFSPLILVQYFLLRQHIQRASLYALANFASVIIFGQFVGIYGAAELQRFAFSGILQGAVTGLTLLWLFGMAQQDKVQETQAIESDAVKRLSDTKHDEAHRLEDETKSVSSTSL